MKYTFGNEIRKRRIEKGIGMEMLCDGLYSKSMMNFIENDERTPDRLMCNRLMDRLGISEDDYEIYLDDEDYTQWLERQRIVGAFIDENIALVNKLLDDYECNNNMKNKMCRQFLLFMRGEAAKMENKESADFYEQAVKITVPKIDTKGIAALCLSVQELNMVLEYAAHKGASERNKLYREVFNYLQNNTFDIHNMSKIYPKMIYYIYRADALDDTFDIHLNKIDIDVNNDENKNEIDVNKTKVSINDYENKSDVNANKTEIGANNTENKNQINVKNNHDIDENIEQNRDIRKEKYINLCDHAIDILRDACRTYYLLELLDIKIELISETLNFEKLDNGSRKYITLREQMDEAKKWKELYEDLSERARISGYMKSDVHLYFEGMAYNVSDVVRIRRKMLGMTASELAEGICSPRTVLRVEQKQCKNHRDITSELLERLGVTYQLYRTDLVSVDAQAQIAIQKFSKFFNRYKGYEQGINYICNMKKLADENTKINYLTLEFIMLVNEKTYGKINKDEFAEGIKALLECTISYDAIMNTEEIFLTNNEIKCLKEIIDLGDIDCIKLCQKVCKFYGKIEEKVFLHPYIIFYEYIMKTVASCYGDCGMYDESDELAEKLLEICLKCRRTQLLPRIIYNNVWNSRVKEKREKYNDLEKEELNKCIAISEFTKNDVKRKFYQRKKEI